MRKLLTVSQAFLLFFVLGQTPEHLKNTLIPEKVPITVQADIKKTVTETEQSLKEAAELKRKNELDIQEIADMNKKKQTLVASAIKKMKLLLKRTKQQKEAPKKTIISFPPTMSPDKVYVVADSICSEYTRNFLGISKCTKWEVRYKEADTIK